jgi:hypothetical protein
VKLYVRAKTDLSTRAVWQSCQQSHLVAKQEEFTKEFMNLAYDRHLFHISKGFSTCRKILHGADGFTSPPKEGLLRIFVALKSPSPRLGLNPQTLAQVSSTLTSRPPRTGLTMGIPLKLKLIYNTTD